MLRERWQLGRQLLRYFGPEWLAYRAWYAFRLRSGLVRRQLPAMRWEERPLSTFLQPNVPSDPEEYAQYRQNHAGRFFFDANERVTYQRFWAAWDTMKSPAETVSALKCGTLTFYHHLQGQVGFPPQWHRNPFTGQMTPVGQHWSQIGDFAYGDIKTVWEPSRFTFVFALVRAYWRSGDEQIVELFWQLVEDWYDNNWPQQGANWKCGQEVSLRVMAWCFGLYGFANSPVSTPKRVAQLAHMIAVSGQRIEGNLQYALSQRNNHGISEGMGLWTIGLLFPEFAAAEDWREKGQAVLEKQGHDLIDEDGSFAQHSVNYHRLMLHDYLWCMRLGEVNERPFSPTLYKKINQAGNWLYQLQAGQNGEVPYYGQIDGALILPLNNCDFRDFRPVIQVTHYFSSHQRCYGSGIWDEDLLWLFGTEALVAVVSPPLQTDFAATVAGYYTWRTSQSLLFTRCGPHRERPSQADMLHIDLWWRGQPIAIDPGTYSYNAPHPWNNPLAATRYHNAVIVDSQEQMQRIGKFLWLPWVQGQVQADNHTQDGMLIYWQGSHDGYERLNTPVTYQRGVIRWGSETWLILDRLQSVTEHDYRLHWLLADWPLSVVENEYKLQLQTPDGSYRIGIGAVDTQIILEVVRGDNFSPRGWYAPFYQQRQPAHSVTAVVKKREVLFWTLFSAENYQVRTEGNTITVSGIEGDLVVKLTDPAKSVLVSELYQQGLDHRKLSFIS